MEQRGESRQPRGRSRTRGHGGPWLREQRPQRGHHAPLSQDEIVRAAIEVADAEGADALSMRRVARQLNAGAMSLYWHISSKEELLALVLDEVFGEVMLPEQPTGDWRADLRLFAMEHRRVFLRHPWVMSLLSSESAHSPNSLRNVEFSLAAMDHLEIDAQTKLGIFWSLHVFTEGFLMHEVVRADILRQHDLTEDDWREALEPYIRQITASDDYPQLTRAVSEFSDFQSDKQFEFGLDSLLDGIAARIDNQALQPSVS
jgi:AcrR family transcriptional regulator